MNSGNLNLKPKENLNVGIHQPNYFPWLGYFAKIKKSDVFVFLDDVQFSKNSWQNRVNIKSPNGKQFLTQPVNRINGIFTSTNEIIFSTCSWKSKHLKTIQLNYKKAKFFDEFFPIVEYILNNKVERMSEFNIFAVKNICNYLKLNISFFQSSQIKAEGNSSQRIINILKSFNAFNYIHGKGANSYHDVQLFQENNIKLIPIEYNFKEYKQLWGEFIPGLSILDICFNLDKESILNML